MTHKVHPKSFRIRSMSDWGSRGFYGKNMPGFLEEDLQIRDFLEKRLKDAGLAKVDIERFPGRIIVMVEALRPGFIIGRGGGGIEILRKSIEKIISRGRKKRFLSSAKSPIDKGIIKLNKTKDIIILEKIFFIPLEEVFNNFFVVFLYSFMFMFVLIIIKTSNGTSIIVLILMPQKLFGKSC